MTSLWKSFEGIMERIQMLPGEIIVDMEKNVLKI